MKDNRELLCVHGAAEPSQEECRPPLAMGHRLHLSPFFEAAALSASGLPPVQGQHATRHAT